MPAPVSAFAPKIQRGRATPSAALNWSVALLLLLLAACAAESEAPRFDERACTSFVVPTRLGLRWENLNHRISRYAIQLAPAPGAACLAERVETVFIGGDYSTGETLTDAPHLGWSGLRVVAADPAQVGAARVRLEAVVDASAGGEVTVRERFDRDALHLLHYPHVVALVEGIALRTDVDQAADYPADYDPARGYTSRGIGAELRVVQLDDAELWLDATLRFAHGTSDRKNMNAAMAAALTEVQVDVLLLGLAEAPIEGAVETQVEAELPPFMRDVEIPHAPEAERRLFLGADRAFHSPASSGLYGWTGFRFLMEPSETPGAGYYIRELSVALSPVQSAVDGDGRITFDVDGYASNASKFVAYYGLRSHFEGQVAWSPGVLSEDGVGASAEPLAIDEAFETGAASFELAP